MNTKLILKAQQEYKEKKKPYWISKALKTATKQPEEERKYYHQPFPEEILRLIVIISYSVSTGKCLTVHSIT